MTCDFKTGDKKKLDRHLESPGHLEKLESGLEGLEVINSPTPRKDIVKLSKKIRPDIGPRSAPQERERKGTYKKTYGHSCSKRKIWN